MDLQSLILHLKSGLIVSCQALPDDPLYGFEHMAAMAVAALRGGAIGIRANSPVDILAIRRVVDLPIIGLFKVDLAGFDVRITPTLDHAHQVANAGADVIAIDATNRKHPGGMTVPDLIDQIHKNTGKPVMADVANVDEGLAAADAGADFVATTLSGYSNNSPIQDGPDFNLLKGLVAVLRMRKTPVIAEGRIASPAEAAQALALGAHAVVVGSAITRPQWITERFVVALKTESGLLCE